MPDIDKIIHQPVRLRIMACLVALASEEQVDFTYLRDALQVTDGNLGAHLQTLEEAGYIDVEKTYVARKPRTFVSASDRGRAAFTEHASALKAIIDRGRGRPDDVEPFSTTKKLSRNGKHSGLDDTRKEV